MARFSFSGPACNRGRTVTALMAVLCVLTCAASALAGGGIVLPPGTDPKGYSLSDLAVETAVYNVGAPAPEPLPDVPFEILIDDATVKAGTMLYMPIFNWDNSSSLAADFPDLPTFPTDIGDQDDDADYLDSVAADLFGVSAFFVQVDGKTTVLSDDYVAGVTTEDLPGGGDQYIVSAVVLTPLTPGQHSVNIGGLIGGMPQVFVSYTVTVQP